MMILLLLLQMPRRRINEPLPGKVNILSVSGQPVPATRQAGPAVELRCLVEGCDWRGFGTRGAATSHARRVHGSYKCRVCYPPGGEDVERENRRRETLRRKWRAQARRRYEKAREQREQQQSEEEKVGAMCVREHAVACCVRVTGEGEQRGSSP